MRQAFEERRVQVGLEPPRCWLTAAEVTRSSFAAAAKLPRRADASNARSAFSGGERLGVLIEAKNILASAQELAARAARRRRRILPS